MKYGLIRTFSPPAHSPYRRAAGQLCVFTCHTKCMSKADHEVWHWGGGGWGGIVDCSLQALFAFILAGLKGMTVV